MTTVMENKLGIITHIDQDYIYIWNKYYPTKETKFPRWGSYKDKEWFELGEMVNFKIPTDFNEVQDTSNIEKNQNNGIWKEESIVRTMTPGVFFIPGHLTFLSEDEWPYSEQEKMALKNLGCNGIANSTEYDKLALFSPKIVYEPKKLYKGFVTRIDKSMDWIAQKIGTLLVIGDIKQLEEVTNPTQLETHRKLMEKPAVVKEAKQINNRESGLKPQIPDSILREESTSSSTRNDDNNIFDNTESTYQHVPASTITKPATVIVPATTTKASAIIVDYPSTSSSSNSTAPTPAPASTSAIQTEESILKENELFAAFLTNKLQGILDKNPSAYDVLSERIMELCIAEQKKMGVWKETQ